MGFRGTEIAVTTCHAGQFILVRVEGTVSKRRDAKRRNGLREPMRASVRAVRVLPMSKYRRGASLVNIAGWRIADLRCGCLRVRGQHKGWRLATT